MSQKVLDKRKALASRLEAILDHSLGSALLPGKGRKNVAGWRVDWLWMFVLAPAVILSSFLFEYFDDPNGRLFEYLGWMQLWFLGFLYSASVLAHRIQQGILETLGYEVLPSLSDASVDPILEELERKFRKRGFRNAFLVYFLPWLAIVIPAMIADLNDISGKGWSWCYWPFWSWLIVIIPVALASSKAGCTSTFYPVLSHHSSLAEFGEHLIAPEESPFVRGMLRIGGLLVLFMSYASVYLISLLLWVDRFPRFVAAHLAVVAVLSLGVGIVTYVRAYDRLRVLASRQRQRVMKALESRMNGLILEGVEESPGARAQGAFELLLQKRGSLSLSGILKAALPILLQLAAVIVAAAALWSE